MRLVLIFSLALFVTAIISCSSENTTEPDFSTAKELWESKKLSNYTLDQIKGCFCLNAGVKVRIEVKADTIFSITKIDDSQLIPNDYFCSVKKLFEIIEAEQYDSIEVVYNSEYGYPQYVNIDPQDRPVDGGILYVSSNLVPVL